MACEPLSFCLPLAAGIWQSLRLFRSISESKSESDLHGISPRFYRQNKKYFSTPCITRCSNFLPLEFLSYLLNCAKSLLLLCMGQIIAVSIEQHANSQSCELTSGERFQHHYCVYISAHECAERLFFQLTLFVFVSNCTPAWHKPLKNVHIKNTDV